ncbi:MAG: hypothetical protein KDA59_01215, partial [Planctomycetales bacterium]|nr:hypothetical protein [Planctomycetales bacterium]
VFLVIGCAIALVTALSLAKQRRRTVAGDRLLKSYKSETRPKLLASHADRLGGQQVAMSVAVFGAAALAGTSLAPVQAAWKENMSHGFGSSDGGCGGGCGSG